MERIHSSYNRFAGQNLERLAALSDGIFSVAMTLLVLDLHVPDAAGIVSEHGLISALKVLSPRLMTYLMSFLTLGIFWIGQQTQLNFIERGSRHLAWLHLAFLALVTLVPFTTSLLATFITFRWALLIYWANIFLLGIAVLAAWLYARRTCLIKADWADTIHRAFMIRVLTAQALYAAATLASFQFGNYVSIALIVLVQLNYAIAPKLIFRARIPRKPRP
ncbi:MAG: TMEM175 family protein [Bdellovibrionota bacterium]